MLGYRPRTDAAANEEPDATGIRVLFVDDEDRVRALEAGYQAYLTKPVEPETLAAALVQLGRVRPQEP